MKKIAIFFGVVILIFYLASDFIKSGKLQQFIDDNSDKTWAPTVQYKLGVIYQTISKDDSAELCFNRILDKYTSSQFTIDSIFQLGSIYEETRRFPKAKEMYRRILDEYPNYENRNLAEKRLNYLSN